MSLRRLSVRTPDIAEAIAPWLLFAAVGVELVGLVTWLPDTLGVWFFPDRNGYGDFPIFYRNARAFSLNALYSPGLTVLMHPLTWLSMRPAFGVYTGVNVAALAGVAYIAQGGVRSYAAKAAVVLGVLALPQTHWAIRVGHFTEVLAFAALGGLLLSDRKPVLAGLLLGVLALKPQYLPVPLLYLAFTRNWRALAACMGALGVLGLAGVVALALREPSGFGMFGYVADYYREGIARNAGFLTIGQRDQIYPQGWQYSWYGFLVSAGFEPNPLLAGELFALSFAAVVLAWWRCTPSVARAATALGMLLLTPHTTFYNWSMLSVAAALLLRSDLRPRWLVPAMLAGVALAAAASQNATPFPLPVDLYRPAATRGLYWVQPAALLCVAVMAVLGRGRAEERQPNDRRSNGRRPTPAARRIASPARMAGGVAALAAGAIAAAWVTGAGPFASPKTFAETQVLGALPADFPAPPGATLDAAGAGERLPYRIEWHSEMRTNEVAALMRQRLDDGSWRIVDEQDAAGVASLRSTRESPDGDAYLAELRIDPAGDGSDLRLEFTPLPVSRVPGYERWLESIGIVVHQIDPDSPAAQVTPSP